SGGGDEWADGRVVDRGRDGVVAGVGRVEPDVDEERLAVPPLVLVHAVVPENLDPVRLDDHSATAAATVSASTCSRTSWTRRIVAPRSYAITAAAMLADSGPC